jgi:hypothetical protein
VLAEKSRAIPVEVTATPNEAPETNAVRLACPSRALIGAVAAEPFSATEDSRVRMAA